MALLIIVVVFSLCAMFHAVGKMENENKNKEK